MNVDNKHAKFKAYGKDAGDIWLLSSALLLSSELVKHVHAEMAGVIKVGLTVELSRGKFLLLFAFILSSSLETPKDKQSAYRNTLQANLADKRAGFSSLTLFQKQQDFYKKCAGRPQSPFVTLANYYELCL